MRRSSGCGQRRRDTTRSKKDGAGDERPARPGHAELRRTGGGRWWRGKCVCALVRVCVTEEGVCTCVCVRVRVFVCV